MAKLFQRRVRVLLAASLAGFGLWKLAPATPALGEVDRLAFRSVAGAFANPPFFISGDGTHEHPWGLRTLAAPDPKAKKPLPAVVAIGDDKDEVFQSSPPSPVDYAVILRNLDRLGVRHLAIGAVISWESADPYAKEAFSSRLKAFESVVAVTPLSRASTEDRMPAEIVRSSLPVEQVHGDVGELPVVNHLPVPHTVFGDARTLVGFSELESEKPSERRPLVARWGDRVVFAFPVMAVLAEKGLPVDGIDLRPGSYLKLGPEGPVVPIDASGRMADATAAEVPPAEPVESLLDAESLPSDGSVLLRDDRTAADRSTVRFSSSVAHAIAAIRSDAGLSAPKEFRRQPWEIEACLIGQLVVFLVASATRGTFRLKLWFGIFFGAVVAAQLIAMAFACWLPGLPLLAALLGGLLGAWPFGGKSVLPAPVAAPPQVAPDSPEPEVPAAPAPFAPFALEVQETLPLVAAEPKPDKPPRERKPAPPEAPKPEPAPPPAPKPASPAKKAAKKAAKPPAKQPAKKAPKKKK
ncbi:hypothetical protein [Luteolibacter sp. LG18]|uniref:hypothetical protein n=1 Tax=Luteolibacter sp. LG18 TaxID=2819286 RepID=UPI002B30C1AB|nr:hypothetical protein llg_06840 [Luteolibacter sp. LG18]